MSFGVMSRVDFSVLWPLSFDILEAPPHFLKFRFNIFSCLWKGTYRVSQEERAKVREGVSYVKLY